MDPKVVIQLRKEFESMKQFRKKNASHGFFYFGYISQFILGVYIIGLCITSQRLSETPWMQWIAIFIGIIVLSQSLYLIFRYHYDKHWMNILELLLSESKEDNK
jgi:uncharacterized membrane protein YhaH (DUF805 family)